MAKSRKGKSQKKAAHREGHFSYCPDCGCRRKINGTCQVCGVTDKKEG